MLGYHNHNFFCDGKENLEAYIQQAVLQGFNHFGFSSHAPFFFENKWSITTNNLTNYSSEIDFLTKKYSNLLRVFKSLEVDYAPGFINRFQYFRDLLGLDYTIGSIHYVVEPKTKQLFFIDGAREDFMRNLDKIFNGNIKLAVQRYFAQTAEMIINEKPDIIGHIDKIIMNASPLVLEFGHYPDWYLIEMQNILSLVSAEKRILEFNLRGLYKGKWHTGFPDEQFLNQCSDLNIDMVISNDAHHPSEIGLFYTEAVEKLKKAGIKDLFEFH